MEKQQYVAFSKLTDAAKAGDADMIRNLLRCGAELDAVDYDGRTAFAMVSKQDEGCFTLCLRITILCQACYEGSFKVVELLLDEGVDKNTKNRWNMTPLNEAMSNRSGLPIQTADG